MEDRNAMIAQIKALKELQRRRAKRTFHDFLSIGKELEHIALDGYIKKKRRV